MMTLEQIIDTLTEQSLVNKFRGETDDPHATFLKFADPQSLWRIVTYINLAEELKSMPVSFISYNESTDELIFNTHFFSKVNGQVNWSGQSIEPIKWVRAIENKYILTFPSGSRVGQMLNTRIQAIDKIL